MLREIVEEIRIEEAKAPKNWDSMFASQIIKDYKSGKLSHDNIVQWDKDFNGGSVPKPAFNTKEILDYHIKTNKEAGK